MHRGEGWGKQSLPTTPFRFTRGHERESGFASLTRSCDFIVFVLARAGTNSTSSQGNGTSGKVTDFIDSVLSKAC